LFQGFIARAIPNFLTSKNRKGIFMKNYQNARDVLPAELLRELRRYHTGALYVPAGDSTFEREALVVSMHERGATRKEISQLAGISVRRVSQIIKESKNKTGETI